MEALPKEKTKMPGTTPIMSQVKQMLLIAGAALTLLILTTGIGAWLWSALRDQTEPPVAEEPAVVDHAGCTFINGNRPQVGTKFVVRCDDGEHLATAEYRGGGVFLFSEFEEYPTPK